MKEASGQTRIGRMLQLYLANTEQTVRDLAPEVGISIATLSRIERGGECDIDTFLKLIAWLDARSAMTPADLTARILKAAKSEFKRVARIEYEPHYSEAVKAEQLAAAREALIAVLEDIDDGVDAMKGHRYADGFCDANAETRRNIRELLTALQGGDDGTEGTRRSATGNLGTEDRNRDAGSEAEGRSDDDHSPERARQPEGTTSETQGEVTPSLVAPEERIKPYMPVEAALLPCPFCGSPAQLTNVRMSDHTFIVGCYNEACVRPRTDGYSDKDAVIALWNTRQSPSVAPEGEKMTAMADAAEMLWIVLANVSGCDWSKQTPEWQEAAARWRDNYFKALQAQRLSQPPSLVSPAPQEED